MKAKTILWFVLVFISCSVYAQSKFKLNQKYAKSVVNSIFYAAQSDQYDHLYSLCDPNGYSDRDAKRICFTAQLAGTVKGGEGSESAKQNLAEFVSIFKPGKINGTITYQSEGDTEYAKVPIWYNHPQTNRSNETLTLVKRSGKWYLFSF